MHVIKLIKSCGESHPLLAATTGKGHCKFKSLVLFRAHKELIIGSYDFPLEPSSSMFNFQ